MLFRSPSYDGTEPSKVNTAQYTYDFTGWTPTISTVTGDITYTATYSATTIPEIVAGDEDEKTTPTTTQPSEVVAGDEEEVDVVPTGENYLYLVVATLFTLSGGVVLVPAIKKVRVNK